MCFIFTFIGMLCLEYVGPVFNIFLYNALRALNFITNFRQILFIFPRRVDSPALTVDKLYGDYYALRL